MSRPLPPTLGRDALLELAARAKLPYTATTTYSSPLSTEEVFQLGEGCELLASQVPEPLPDIDRIFTAASEEAPCRICGRPLGEHAGGAWSRPCPPVELAAQRAVDVMAMAKYALWSLATLVSGWLAAARVVQALEASGGSSATLSAALKRRDALERALAKAVPEGPR